MSSLPNIDGNEDTRNETLDIRCILPCWGLPATSNP